MDFKLKKSELNFRVYTAPSFPATGTENDICIKSEVPMTNWVMSPDKPSGIPRTDGDVWIQYSVTGDTFNVLKNNTMMIATIFAWQYVNGAWVDVEAKSYQNGEWVDWFPSNVLYQDGTINKNLGGGLEVYKTVGASSVTFGDSTFSVNIADNTHSAIVGTKEKIDLSKYSKLVIVIDSADTSGEMFMAVRNDKQNLGWSNIHNDSLAIVKPKAAGTYELPVSNLGTAYVCFGGVETYKQKMVISKWYFE